MDGPAIKERGPHRVLRFGTFELDLAGNELRKAGVLVKLQSQHIQLLVLLAQRSGQVVSRDEIRQALWDEQTFVDFDRSINFCVNQIRRALGDDPQSPRYIETLPRKGYRFIAPVTEAGGDRAAAPEPRPIPVAKRVPAKPWWWAAGTVAAIGLALLAVRAAGWPDRLAGRKPVESLAVLPLENLSHDPEEEYFADGMTDELITTLAKISALRVISRTSVMQYKGTKKPLPQIARELNVDAVLEGTVMRESDRVRITAQLIRAAPEKHLWAETYEASLSRILTVQNEVAAAVAQAIRVKVTEQERTQLAKPRTVAPAAYEAYLKGRYLWEIKGEENLLKSRDFLELSIKADPGYAMAWAGLADTYNYLSSWGVLARQETAPRARASAEKALELDKSLVTPLVSLAQVKTQYEWDWAGAERLYRQAIELNPNYGDAHHEYATYLAAVGRTEEALVEARRAHEVEPLSLEYAVNVPWKLYFLRRYEEAESEFRKLTGWWPWFHGSYILASIYFQTGRQREAISLMRQSVTDSRRGNIELMFLARMLGASGARSEVREVLEEMQQLSRRRYVPPEYIAMVYEGLGERDRAVQWFETAYREHSMNVWFLPDPSLDPIRSDERFKNIMRRMGLPQ